MLSPFSTMTVLTIGAAGLVWLLQKWKLSPVLAYLALGVLIAPFKETLFPYPDQASQVADFGVILLMFFIGLEFRLEQARAMLAVCLGSGALQVGLTASAAGLLAWWLGTGVAESLVLGFMVAMSSTALVMKTFEDRREADSQRARLFLAVSLFQDIAAIVVVALLPLIAGLGNSSYTPSGPGQLSLVWRLVLLFVGLPVTFLGFRYLLPKIFEKAAMARVPEAFSLLSLGACMCVALTAQAAGASMALGAFLGGLVLTQTPFTSQIMAELTILRNLALGFFFVSVGMLMDVGFVARHAPILLAGLAGLVVLKFVLALVALRIARIPLAVAAGVALPLAQVGEFSFVVSQQAGALGLIGPFSAKTILALALLTMMLAPFWAGWSAPLTVWVNTRFPARNRLRLGPAAQAPVSQGEVLRSAPVAPPPPQAAALKAVVVGYGPVGRTLTRILRDFGIEPSIIEMNLQTVHKLNNGGLKAVYGDAGRREILAAAGIEDAAYLLITLPDLPGRIPIVATARLMNPKLKILSRARYLGEKSMLDDAGVTAASYEEAEVAVGLAGILLREVGANEEAIRAEASRIRNEIGTKTGFTMLMPRPKIKP